MQSLLDYIGRTIQANNPKFSSFRVNGIQMPDGRVVEFTDGKEKRFIGVSDTQGTAGYIRVNPQINYPTERRLTSGQTTVSAVKSCRLVAFSFDPTESSETMMNKMVNDLKNFTFTNYSGGKPSILIRRSNQNYLDNLTEEFRKEPNETGGYGLVCISIDFDLKYYPSECDECFEAETPNCLTD